ncbi:MAG TPA: hypothetical protein VF727_10420 [Allosphingosinicella sp.]
MAAKLAQNILNYLDSNREEPETPYYRAATRAEALLLLDRDGEAQEAFAEAVALAPEAWEDHASTLRQFALILEAQGKDAAWLEPHRPPKSLHFGGHMSFDARVARRQHLDNRIAEVLAEERVHFGFGALAAGADIIIAEALLDRGAEVHAVLPGGPDAFAAASVDPFGKGWRRRYDAVLKQAASVRIVGPEGLTPDATIVAVADEVAMGMAVMNARRLESRALQLLVLPAEESAAKDEPAHAHARWAEAGWRQRILTAPREAPLEDAPGLPAAAHERLAVLVIAPGAAEGADARLRQIATELGKGPPPRLPPFFNGREAVTAYAEAADAAQAATGVARAFGEESEVAVGGYYGVVDPVEDPFSGQRRPGGDAVPLASAAAASAPPGTVLVSADFAAALAASGAAGFHLELVGELEARDGGAPVDLYGISARL